MAKILPFQNMKKISFLKCEKLSSIKNKFLAASQINNEHSEQEKDHFCEQQWKIFANDIFHISNTKISSYFEMENFLPFCLSHNRKNPFARLVRVVSCGPRHPALKSPFHVVHKFSVHSIFRLSSNFIVFLSGISQPCIQTFFFTVCSIYEVSKHIISFIFLERPRGGSSSCKKQSKVGGNRGL